MVITRAGVTIAGVGSGTLQPQIKLTTATTAAIKVSASNVTLQNLRISADFAAIAIGLSVNSTDCAVLNCRFDEIAADSGTWASAIATAATTSNLADGLTVVGCTIIGTAAANTYAINSTGTNDRVLIADNYINFNINSTNAAINCASGKNLTNVQILRNRISRLATGGRGGIYLQGTANTGTIADNRIVTAASSLANLKTAVTGQGCDYEQNYACPNDGGSGILVPAATTIA
jgi:hypothetical protein